MLATIEQVWMLAAREIRLTARNRARLVSALAVPLTGGVVCGWMTRTTSLPPVYCLILFMALGGILLAADPSVRVSRTLSSIAGQGVFTSGWALATLVTLVVQTVILTACAALIGGFQVSIGILAGTVGLALVVSTLVHRVLAA